jgi:hypothetical protein
LRDDLGRSWIGSSGCFGFFGFSMLEGALEAVRVVTAALFSHSGVEHLGACCALGLSEVGGWCGQDGRSYGYSGFLLGGGLLLVQIVVLHLLENNSRLP